MLSNLPIGVSDFRKLRETELLYIDKTHLVCELVNRKGIEAVLLPRPRRFGKTLNLSMLSCYFSKRDEDLSHLFEGLAVWEAGEQYRKHFQRYPVIYLSFQDVKASTAEASFAAIRKNIQVLFDTHRYLLDAAGMSERECRDYREVLDGTAQPALYQRALLDLSALLHRHHRERVLILIDEYDEPIHAGYVHEYANDILEFFRAFLAGGLKDNPHLYKAVVTGVLRVARESIFSGLNNLGVYSLLREEFATCFGFTHPEVVDLLDRAGRGDQLDLVQHWYDGYRFGNEVIYNPWSVLSFLADVSGKARPHWVTTSSNDLVKHLLERHAFQLEPAFETLLAGGSIERDIDENVALGDLEHNHDALWSLLVFSGYLRAEERPRDPMLGLTYALTIPNYEVRQVYTSTFRAWMDARLRGNGGNLDRLVQALLRGDAERVEDQLQVFADSLLSYHDTARPDPELLYHGFVLGLLAVLEPEYAVRSNRESGRGRPDVQIRPNQPGKPGVVLELKVARPGRQTLDEALAAGLAQIAEKDYAAELRVAGADPIHVLVVAFDGKSVAVRAPS
jgi:hypothetical protein